MRDRFAFAFLAVSVIAAVAVIWLWWSDAWLIHQCHTAGGSWNADTRICAISAGPTRESPASPHR